MSPLRIGVLKMKKTVKTVNMVVFGFMTPQLK